MIFESSLGRCLGCLLQVLVCGTSIERDAMRRQPNALNLVDCAVDVAVKRGRYDRSTPDDSPVLDQLGVREVPVPHNLKQSA
jgi:hypothetical protein